MWRLRTLLRHLSPAAAAATRPPPAWMGDGAAYYSSAVERKKGKTSPLQARGMVDRFRLRAKGGDGGNGCISLKRSRSDRQGKPDGGNGGKGGDVILECSRSIWDFSNLQHHMKASRGGHGVSKNQIGTRGSDKVAQVPVGTVVHLVRGEKPLLAGNKPIRSLDPWDIPDAMDDSSASSNQMKHKMAKGLDDDSSSQQLASNDSSDGNEAGQRECNRKVKQTYFNPRSNRGFSSIEDGDVSSYTQEKVMDEEELFEDGDEEYWDDEGESEGEGETAEVEVEVEEVQYSVAEMTKPGQRLIIARGGDGGVGNACFAKDTRFHKPRQAEIAQLSNGKCGTEAFLILELKSIADVGLVGMPNAGKSTLLSALSMARPEIADYAFTTLRPNIGSLTYEDYFSVKVADIPGLINGAHKNRGLGHAFLRHIERTKVLAYVLDLTATLNGKKGIPPWEQLRDLVVELELYQEGLTRRPSLIIANKTDEEGADMMYEELKRRVQGVPIFPVCAILREGMPDLRVGLRNLMDISEPQGVDLSKIFVD